MTLHIVKLCVGADSVDDLRAWQRQVMAALKKRGQPPLAVHTTRMYPKRREEILGGGSLYWVIKGFISVRQRIEDIVAVTDREGISRCNIMLDPELVPVMPVPRRAFQGWRYLEAKDAPGDAGKTATDLPESLRRELAELGLL